MFGGYKTATDACRPSFLCLTMCKMYLVAYFLFKKVSAEIFIRDCLSICGLSCQKSRETVYKRQILPHIWIFSDDYRCNSLHTHLCIKVAAVVSFKGRNFLCLCTILLLLRMQFVC